MKTDDKIDWTENVTADAALIRHHTLNGRLMEFQEESTVEKGSNNTTCYTRITVSI